jgi:phosphoribosylformylglycinamidine (FGAM) synthase PurS component
MNLIYKIVSFLFVVLVIIPLNAENLKPQCEVNQIVRQICNCHNLTESREAEFLFDTSIVYVKTPCNQVWPSVGSDGTNSLVVWPDVRRGNEYDIYGTRINQSGEVLDPECIPISTADGSQVWPSVASDGTNYLVVWQDWRGGGYDIYGSRVSQDGAVLDPEGILISTAAGTKKKPSVIFGGTNYLVVWEDHRNGYYPEIYGARVSQSGEVLDPEGIAISTGAFWHEVPCVSYDGTNWLIVWSDARSGYNIYGARVSQDGVVLDPEGIAISTGASWQGLPCVSHDGTNYLVVWQDYRNDYYPEIYGARVSQDGVVLDPEGIAISTGAFWHEVPCVSHDGINYLVVWQDWRGGEYDIYGSRVSQDGEVLDPEGIPISTAIEKQGYPSVVFDGANWFVVWEDYRYQYHYDICATRVGQNGVVLDPEGILISTAAHWQEHSFVAFDGTNYLVVWQDWRSCADDDIYGVRVSQDGTVLDPEGIPISTAVYWQECPSVAFNGTNYLVVWEDRRDGDWWNCDIYGARVSQDGVVLDPEGIAISTATENQGWPLIASDGTNWFVAWTDARSYEYDVYGARVSQGGVVLDPEGIPISTAAFGQSHSSLAFDGTNYLVVWQDYRSTAFRDIYGARVGQDGTVLDPSGMPIATTGAYDRESPTVAFDGTNYLVVWEKVYGLMDEHSDIYGVRVNQDGVVLDPSDIPISTAAGVQRYSSVAYDDTNYIVVWQDDRNGNWDIYGAKVNQSGTVIDSFTVSTQLDNQFAPALCKGSGNQLLTTYSGWTDSINTHPADAMRIWGKFYPFVGIEETRDKASGARYGLQVQPNPFSKLTKIKFQTPSSKSRSAIGGVDSRQKSVVSIKIYDVSGRLIKRFDYPTIRQFDQITWYGDDNSGKKLPQGVYFVKLNTDDYSETKKVIFIK